MRCRVCEAAIDVLDSCSECSGAPRAPGMRGRKPGDPCKYGHQRHWDAHSERWRCKECNARLKRLRRLRLKVNE